MTEIGQRKESSFENDSLKCRLIEWPIRHLTVEPQIYCAYNRTREQFICARVELADLQHHSLDKRLAGLTPGSNTALWLSQFRGISPNRVTTPIDLVFLDRNNCVLAVVDSFPTTRATSTLWPAGTVIALPARTVARSDTRAGDQLILCSPQKMMLRLHILNDSSPGVLSMQYRSNRYSLSHDVPPILETAAQTMSWEEIRH